MSEKRLNLEGGCFCGKLRYCVTAAPLWTLMCHCTDCQEMTASAFSLCAIIATDSFSITSETQPEGHRKTADNGAISTRFVCPECATWTHTQTTSSTEMMIVRPSSLDDHSWFKPVAQLYTRSAQKWALLPMPLSYEEEFPEYDSVQAVYKASGISPGRSL
ncbi:GFA family protein [Phyllobacterium sp. K27]